MKPLEGTVTISGSKNAALPILAATLLTDEQVVITNVPDIQDVRSMLRMLEYIGSEYVFEENTVTIQTTNVLNADIPPELCLHLRASLLLVGPLLARARKASIGYPGGCVIGKRPIDTHLDAFVELGVHITEVKDKIFFDARKMKAGSFVLKEISVTATENLLMCTCLLSGTTVVRLAAMEPHVQDLCHFLNVLGASVQGIGTHTVTVSGVPKLHGSPYRVASDYLEAGSLAIAAAATGGDVTLLDIYRHDLDALWQKLAECGVRLDFADRSVRIRAAQELLPIRKLDTGIFPKFPTDLQAPFMVLMTQAHGVSKVFETLFEGRLSYLFELEQMGARVELLNPHQALVVGPTVLTGVTVASCDIRAGTAMIVAGLIGEGTTEITNVNYIDRGYERFDDKLRGLGADIVRLQSEDDFEQRSLAPRASVRPAPVLRSPPVS